MNLGKEMAYTRGKVRQKSTVRKVKKKKKTLGLQKAPEGGTPPARVEKKAKKWKEDGNSGQERKVEAQTSREKKKRDGKRPSHRREVFNMSKWGRRKGPGKGLDARGKRKLREG